MSEASREVGGSVVVQMLVEVGFNSYRWSMYYAIFGAGCCLVVVINSNGISDGVSESVTLIVGFCLDW